MQIKLYEIDTSMFSKKNIVTKLKISVAIGP